MDDLKKVLDAYIKDRGINPASEIQVAAATLAEITFFAAEGLQTPEFNALKAEVLTALSLLDKILKACEGSAEIPVKASVTLYPLQFIPVEQGTICNKEIGKDDAGYLLISKRIAQMVKDKASPADLVSACIEDKVSFSAVLQAWGQS